MGEIIGSSVKDGKVVLKLSMGHDESLSLAGRMKKIHLFALHDLVDTNMITRGRSKSSKFFVLPTSLKTKSKKKPKLVFTQKMETPSQAMFIYVCDKGMSKLDF